VLAENRGDLGIIPLSDVADMPDSDRDSVISAFAANGHENFMLRN
jgi:hypothetical protein